MSIIIQVLSSLLSDQVIALTHWTPQDFAIFILNDSFWSFFVPRHCCRWIILVVLPFVIAFCQFQTIDNNMLYGFTTLTTHSEFVALDSVLVSA